MEKSYIKNYWSESELTTLKQLYSTNLSVPQIAQKMNRKTGAIRSAISRYGLANKRTRMKCD